MVPHGILDKALSLPWVPGRGDFVEFTDSIFGEINRLVIDILEVRFCGVYGLHFR